jgi:hypothetical protein
MLALTLAACAPGDSSSRPDLAITNTTVIDAVQGAREGVTVVVNDGRIVEVAEAGTAVDALAIIDGTGRYLIPGLWDFHVHLTYDARFTEAMPALFLRWGITSIRDTGGPLDLVQPVVERLRAVDATAPRVFFAGPLLDGRDVVYDGVNQTELGIANPDAETARANVARLADAGVDFIKVYEMVTPEVFDALVEASDARGLPRDGHVPLSMLARDVGPQMGSLEHLRNIEMDCAADADERLAARRAALENHSEGSGSALRSRLHREHRLPSVAAYDAERCLEVMAAMRTTIQVPTLRLNALGLRPPFTRADWAAALQEAPPEVVEDWGAVAARQAGAPPARDTTYGAFSLSLVGDMHRQGVPIGAGTDTPIGNALPGYSLHNELEMLVRAGLSPLEALRSATLRPAEFFGLDGEMGTIAVGRLADLVLLSANPLTDISNTRTIEAVVTKGHVMTLAELQSMTPGGR